MRSRLPISNSIQFKSVLRPRLCLDLTCSLAMQEMEWLQAKHQPTTKLCKIIQTISVVEESHWISPQTIVMLRVTSSPKQLSYHCRRKSMGLVNVGQVGLSGLSRREIWPHPICILHGGRRVKYGSGASKHPAPSARRQSAWPLVHGCVSG